TRDTTAVGGPGGLIEQAVERERRFQNLLGSLSVRIDTRASGGATNGNDVNVSGELHRYVAPAVQHRRNDVGVPGSYVNPELVISAGNGVFNVAGASGADATVSARTSTAGNNVATQQPNEPFRLDTTAVGLPDLGLFDVVIESGTLSVPDPQVTGV